MSDYLITLKWLNPICRVKAMFTADLEIVWSPDAPLQIDRSIKTCHVHSHSGQLVLTVLFHGCEAELIHLKLQYGEYMVDVQEVVDE